MKNITKLACGLLLFSIVWFGCKKGSSRSMDLSGTYKVYLNETKKIPLGTNLATLTLTDIVDNRCPANANCVNSGSAIAKVAFKDGLLNQHIDLCLGLCTQELKTITSRGTTYIISVTDISPDPNYFYLSSVPPSATIVIAKMN